MGTEITIGVVPFVLLLVGVFAAGGVVGYLKPATELQALKRKLNEFSG